MLLQAQVRELGVPEDLLKDIQIVFFGCGRSGPKLMVITMHRISGTSAAGMKLLIVEDEVRMADLLRKGLTEEGHTVTCVHDGAEGHELARDYEFDVIILDVMMPKLS